jgi:hypothetical protein
VIIQYGSFKEIEEHILNIEDKAGIFLIEPNGKGKVLVSSFSSGTSQEMQADSIQDYLDSQEGTHAFFVGVRPPKCIKKELSDRYHVKEAIEWCEKIMHLSIGNPSYDQIDYSLENILAIMREVDDESEGMYELLTAKEDPQLDIDPSDLDPFGNSSE